MVEFAIVAPILFLLIFGIYEFSLAYNAKVEITGAAREGARAAALRKSTATVVQAVKAAAPGVSVSTGDVNTVACPADPQAGGDATVTVKSNFTYSIPFFRDGVWEIKATGVMRCGL
jgi:Flp pilus assembly protein TadG